MVQIKSNGNDENAGLFSEKVAMLYNYPNRVPLIKDLHTPSTWWQIQSAANSVRSKVENMCQEGRTGLRSGDPQHSRTGWILVTELSENSAFMQQTLIKSLV